MENIQLTDEQKKVIDEVTYNLNNTKPAKATDIIVKVEALAGTGKSSTLLQIALNNPMYRFFILVFNKLAKTDLQAKIKKMKLSNIEVDNIHGLAYKILVKQGFKLQADYTLFKNICFDLNISNYYNKKQVFSKFCNSDMSINDLANSTIIEKNDIIAIYEYMVNTKIGDYDFFVKYFVLNYSLNNYDCLMLDEAQDTNPVTYSLFQNSQAKVKILVGDRNQAIYGFRGAVNFMQNLKATKTLYLTKSFRFGENVANLVNPLLNKLKSQEIVGIGGKKTNDKKIIITRTNATILEFLINNAKKNKEIYKFVNQNLKTKLKNLIKEFKDLVDYNNNKFLENLNLENYRLNYNGYDEVVNELVEKIKTIKDEELNYEYKLFLELCNKFTFDDVEFIVNKTPIANTKDKLLIGTAHTTKGLEFNEVMISKDFNEVLNNIEKHIFNNELKQEDKTKIYLSLIDELKLFYVAMTRAIKDININDEFIRNYIDKVELILRNVSNYSDYENIVSDVSNVSDENNNAPIIPTTIKEEDFKEEEKGKFGVIEDFESNNPTTTNDDDILLNIDDILNIDLKDTIRLKVKITNKHLLNLLNKQKDFWTTLSVDNSTNALYSTLLNTNYKDFVNQIINNQENKGFFSDEDYKYLLKYLEENKGLSKFATYLTNIYLANKLNIKKVFVNNLAIK